MHMRMITAIQDSRPFNHMQEHYNTERKKQKPIECYADSS